MLSSRSPQGSRSTESEKTMELPQLSNEMQLNIMHMVKIGQLSIDDALDMARRDQLQLLQKRFDYEEKQASLYNFSVHKFSGYRCQKRILQIDFNIKMVCSIDKGIVKRQFSFMDVKNCHDSSGARLTLSFKGHQDFELEATSPQDKQKILELINQIIYRNIYPVDTHEEPNQPPASPKTLHEGQLLLQRGGLASCKWKKYEVHLYPGQLTLLPMGTRPVLGVVDLPVAPSLQVIIHLSDGNASVETPHSFDTFILLTKKDEFQFRVPMNERASTEDIRSERDAWVKAINKQCVDWKRRSKYEILYEDLKSPQELSDIMKKEHQSSFEREPEADKILKNDGSDLVPPVPLPRILSKPLAVPVPFPASAITLDLVPKPAIEPELVAELKPPPLPERATVSSLERRPLPLQQVEPVQSPVSSPLPVPPPLPVKKRAKSQVIRTKAFHWDIIAHDKIVKSVWARESPREIQINTVRLYELFGVKDLSHSSNLESSNHVEIMLNTKIAHNFNIFLKSFPVQPKELKDKLFIVNEGDGGLSDEHITSLRRYVPTADDIEMYKSYKGDVSRLHLVDQYMMEMCNIPYLSTQLDLLLTLRELPISIEDLKPLSQLRGNEKKFTLIHALVEQIMLHEPRLVTFFQELAEFEMVPGASVKGITAEVDVVKNELQKVIQYRKTYKGKNTGIQHSKFSKDLKLAIEKYEADLKDLTKRCEEMRKLYTDILVKFGEPLDQDSQELFGWVCQFINEFKRIHSELTS
ncbi:uncharacterized protein [Hoplias malabaricus]|uniref:uncharacterized protein n=1 Tax=Hoplias malabaricus TaxID=27720 RepID=UPI0034618A82